MLLGMVVQVVDTPVEDQEDFETRVLLQVQTLSYGNGSGL